MYIFHPRSEIPVYSAVKAGKAKEKSLERQPKSVFIGT